MREFLFETAIWLPRPRDEVFPFFADAGNLQALTPPWVNFQILTPMPVEMRQGTLIDYRIRVHGWPMRWRTEITAWNPPHRFVDEQRRGPYQQWIHEHTFTDQDGGTVMRDRVRYGMFGGRLIHRLFIRRDIERIFAFRSDRMQQLFPPRP